MPLVGFELSDGERKSFLDGILDALQPNVRMGMPIVAGIAAEILTHKRPSLSQGFSASQLSGCLRKIILDGKTNYYSKPEDQLYAVRGTFIHKTLEAAFDPKVSPLPLWFTGLFTMEERLFCNINTSLGLIHLSGQYDLLYVPPCGDEIHKTGAGGWLAGCNSWDDIPGEYRDELPIYPILFDHKTTAMCPKEAKPEHIWQCSIYAYLLFVNGKPYPERAEINYVDAKENVAYRVPLHGITDTLAFIKEAYEKLAPAYFRGELPDRVEESGRWCCGLNRAKKSYCAHSGSCWPDGIGSERDDFVTVETITVKKSWTFTPLAEG